MKKALRRSLIGLGATLALAVVLALPWGLFWVRWMTPGTPIPSDASRHGHSQAHGELPAGLRSEFEAILARLRRDAGAPALSAAIARDASLVWAGASGFADLESGVAATTDQRFRLGSTSKAVTGVVLGRLIAAGEITTDTPVRQIAPQLPVAYDAVTVGMLASHTGGTRHYSRVPTWIPSNHESLLDTHFDSVEDGLTLFLDDALSFEPGKGFGYSTFGFSLLSYVMERASGRDFGILLTTEVNDPTGIGILLDDITIGIPSRVSYYTTGDGNYVDAFPSDPSYKWAGGGMIATPSELAALGQKLLLDDLFIPADVRAALWSPVAVPGSDTNPQNYGLGWRRDVSTRLLGEDRPTLMVHHGGIQMGGAAFWMILPEHRVSVAVAANTGAREARGAVQEAAYALARALIDAPPSPR